MVDRKIEDRNTAAAWLWLMRRHDQWSSYDFGYVNGWVFGAFPGDHKTLDQLDSVCGYLHRFHLRHGCGEMPSTVER